MNLEDLKPLLLVNEVADLSEVRLKQSLLV